MKRFCLHKLRDAVALALVSIFLFSTVVRASVTTVSYWRLGENDSGVVVGGSVTNLVDVMGVRPLKAGGPATYSSSVSSGASSVVGSTLSVSFATGSYATNGVISLTDNFGFEVWVNPNNTNGNKTILYCGDGGSSGWGLTELGSTYQALYGGITFFGSVTATPGTWTHLAVVRNNGSSTFYVNGVAAGTTTAAPNSPSGILVLAAGAPNVSQSQFAGLVDEVRVFTFSAGAFSTNDLLLNVQAPSAVTVGSTNVTTSSATLLGSANPGGLATSAYFQYGTTTNYGSFSSTNNLAASKVTSGITNTINSLTLGTVYHFRLVANNGAGGSTGSDMIFSPGGSAPTVTTMAAGSITGTNAMLNATVNPGYLPTTAYFEYGLTTNYGSFSATNSLAATNTTLSVSNLVGNLTAATSYHFRVVASNALGIRIGSDLTFTSVAIPAVTTLAATLVTSNGATFNGTVNPNGAATAAYFRYGLTTNYGSFSATNSLVATNATLSVTNVITGLSYGTVYHFCLVATNGSGAATGSDFTFTTAPLSPTAITLAATSIGGTNATLNGSVNPNGGITTVYFEYGAYTNVDGTGTVPNPSFETNKYSASPGYANANGGVISGWTLSDTSKIGLNPAGGSTPFADNGSIPAETNVAFIQSAGQTNRLSTTISNLVVGKTYQVSFCANSRSAITGPLQATWSLNGGPFAGFTATPAVGGTNAYYTNSGTFIATSTNAPLAIQNYSDGDTTILLDAFTIASVPYGHFTVTNVMAAGTSSVSLSNLVTDLFPNTTYYFHVVASNSTGTTFGSDLTFTTPVVPPIISSASASSIAATNVNLSAAINPGGVVANAYFEYGTTTNYGSFSATNSLAATNVLINLTNFVGGLLPGSAYHFRVVASNSSGTSVGNDSTFTTIPLPPVAVTLSASDISPSNATLNANVDTGNGATTVYFKYGLTTSYGSFSATNLLTATNVIVAVSNAIANLNPGTLYHFQIVASNSSGTALGADQTFTTTPTAPSVTTGIVSVISSNSATLNGSVNPNGLTSAAYFEYGMDTNYGLFTATNVLAATNIPLSVTIVASNLAPAAVYHYRTVGQNSAGTTVGVDQTFTTKRLPVTVAIASTADSGAGTLRQAILDSVPGDILTFDPSLSGASIVLTSGQLVLTNNLTIDGSTLPAGLRINGNHSSRIFQINAGVSVNLSVLTLTNGSAVPSGGAIFNSGTLVLDRCTLAGNSTTGTTGNTGSFPSGTGGVGGLGAGGAVYNAAILIANQCTFALNSTKGGTGGTGGSGFLSRGGTGGTGGTGAGAAIYNAGNLTVSHCTLSANSSIGGNGGPGGSGTSTGNSGGIGAATAGGLYQAGTASLFNSIVAGNSPDDLAGSFTRLGNDLTSGNPLLSSLGDNGGPTATMILLNGSPAFEAGASTSFTNDQRGFRRFYGGAPDLGAVEMIVPDVSALSASDVTTSSATLNGSVNPNGFPAAAYFEYGPTTNYGSVTTTNSLVVTNVALNVSNSVASLQPATTYHFRIVVTNSLGLIRSSDLTYTTGVTAPIASTSAASGITATNTTFNGSVTPNGLVTAAYFEYGIDTNYGSFTVTNSLIATNVSISISTLVTNLFPGTQYHFRIIATNGLGAAAGSDQTFSTKPLVPVVTTLAAGPLTTSNATFNATVNPGNGVTAVYFKYGPTTSYGLFTTTNTVAATPATLIISNVANVSAATLYHFQAFAVNSAGTAGGGDLTFVTDAAAPTVTTLTATAVTATNAFVKGTVNPNGLTTSVYFEYGTDTNYGSFTPTNILSATNTAISLSNVVSTLSPGTLYHFRVVGVNNIGSSAGVDSTFTTAPVPPTAITLEATNILGTTATLTGLVNPGAGVTKVYFAYAADTNAYTAGSIFNGSFETNHYSTSPGYASGNGNTISGWTISNPSRIGLNPAGSSPFADNGIIPDGANVAFIQSNADTNSLSTTISNLVAGLSYSVRFRANSRSGYLAPNGTWSINGGAFVPFTCSPVVGNGNQYYTNSAVFKATDTTAALVVRNATATDTTALIDAFTVAPAPFGTFSPTNTLAATNTAVPVSSTITGLLPDRTYYFYIIAVNSAGVATGFTNSFTTLPPPPTVTTLAATDIAANSATLNAIVTSGGSAATMFFEYGTDTNYGSYSATNSILLTNTTVNVSNLISGLAPYTTYNFRIVATNLGGTTVGTNVTFITRSTGPAITPVNAIILGTNATDGLRLVQVSAVVRPKGDPTTAYFEYGTTPTYGASTPIQNIPASVDVTNISAILSLSAGYSFHWRAVATNIAGAATSTDQTFNLGTLLTGAELPGDLNRDGIISQSELNAVYNAYLTNSPWLYMTNVLGLGQTNVTFQLDNSISGGYSIQYSTNLVDWLPLGPAIPQYLFIDTNAATLPQRYYRLHYP